jgi:pyridoxal phosphate enzyme (YggS family)
LELEQRIKHVEERIREACRRSDRSREEIEVIAVTKYVSLESTQEAFQAGLVHIGENRMQDAQEKWDAIGAQGLGTWHFIGHLQSNKVKDVLGKFEYIHSLDRLSLAKEIEKKASQLEITAKCFVQVNISGEESKFGLAPEKIMSFLETIQAFKHIHIVGLMTMAPFEEEPERTRAVFKGLRELRDELNAKQILSYPVQHLSMGMSNDFEVAVEEGATFLRLGSILVGKDE